MIMELKNQSKLKALVVDDDRDLLEMIVEAFADTDFTIVTARDGSEAFAKIRNDKFDIVLTDIKMPKRDGLNFVKDLRESEKRNPFGKTGVKTPIIVISASIDEYKDFFKDLDPVYLLAKPFNLEKLVALTKLLCSKKTI